MACAIRRMGNLLRNTFYLPLYNEQVQADFKVDRILGEKVSQALKQANVMHSKKCDRIRRHFSVGDIDVCIQGAVPKVFTIRLFESKHPIAGKNLRVFLFSFYGNKQFEKGKFCQWEPASMKELSLAPLEVLKSLPTQMDSWINFSLGNVAAEGLQYLSLEDRKIVPLTVVINRGLSSVWKVASQLYRFPLNYMLYGAAKLLGWNADPEEQFLKFLEKEAPNRKRQVIMIEANRDWYFSRLGAFAADFHKKIAAFGHTIYRACFHPFPFQDRVQHAISLDHLVVNAVTEEKINTLPRFFPKEGESMATVLARDVLLKGGKKWHNCFIVGGNSEPLDIGTANEVVPLLNKVVKFG